MRIDYERKIVAGATMKPTDEMVEKAIQAHWGDTGNEASKMRAALTAALADVPEAEETKELQERIRKLEAPIYLQGDNGWYAISMADPMYCFHAATLDEVKEKEKRARAFITSSNEEIK